MILKKSTWFDGDVDLRSDDKEARREYIKSAIVVAADEARNVLLTAAVGVAVVLFLLKDSIAEVRELGSPYTTLCAVAAAALLIGSGLLLWYAAEINQRRMLLSRCLADSDAAKAREVWAGNCGITKQRGFLLRLGMFAIGLGTLASALVVVGLLGIA